MGKCWPLHRIDYILMNQKGLGAVTDYSSQPFTVKLCLQFVFFFLSDLNKACSRLMFLVIRENLQLRCTITYAGFRRHVLCLMCLYFLTIIPEFYECWTTNRCVHVWKGYGTNLNFKQGYPDLCVLLAIEGMLLYSNCLLSTLKFTGN